MVVAVGTLSFYSSALLLGRTLGLYINLFYPVAHC